MLHLVPLTYIPFPKKSYKVAARVSWERGGLGRLRLAGSICQGPTHTGMFQTQTDGVLQLDAVADELVHESFVCDTRDHEDHTFCGMMVARSIP